MDERGGPVILPGLYQRRAELTPARTAFFSKSGQDWQSQSWGEVWAQIASAAAGMQTRGIQRGVRVGILLPTCLEWEIAQQAVLVIGAVVVGIDSHVSVERIQAIIEHAQISALILDSTHLPDVPSSVLEKLKLVLVVGESPFCQTNIESWENVMATRPFAGAGDWTLDPRLARELATIIYTSGTTGEPKAIAYTHEQVLIACRALMKAIPQFNETLTTICWLPMSSLFQRMAILVAVASGMTSYFLQDPRRIMETLVEVAPSFLIGIPRFFEKLAEFVGEADEHTTEPWRNRIQFMISGSAPLPHSVQEHLYSRGMLVLEAYGCSENTVPIAMNRVADFRFGSVGKPLSDNHVEIAEDGEVLVKGPGLFRGYWGEKMPAELFTPEGFYRTGDYGHFDDDRFLYLTGRKSEIIKTSTGRRISPVAVEDVYRQIPYVEQVVVFGDGHKRLVALMCLRHEELQQCMTNKLDPTLTNSATPSVEQFFCNDLDAVDARLPVYERIRAVGILSGPLCTERGELTANGKLRRRAIETNFCELLDRLYREEDSAENRCVLFEAEPPNRT